MSKKCLICWVTCTSCRGWNCRCWMTASQVLVSNQLIEENNIPSWDYRRQWVVSMLTWWLLYDEINVKLTEWLIEEDQYQYAPKAKDIKEITNNKCKYDWMWVWSRCIKCWVARRDKQHDLSKECAWNDSNLI